MKRSFVLLAAATAVSLPALAQESWYTRSGACDCYPSILMGGPEAGNERLSPPEAKGPATKIIKVEPKTTSGLTIHRGGEVTYTSPDRGIYATTPRLLKGASRRAERRPSRIRTVGRTRIVHAPEAFRPLLTRPNEQ
jgi:hypothetical protein